MLSIIDFGDMVIGWQVVEPVIAATYAMLEQPAPLARAADVVRGYHAEIPLTATEIDLCFDFICMRLCTSVCINAHQIALAPDNEYLSIDVEPCWELLAVLRDIDPERARTSLSPA